MSTVHYISLHVESTRATFRELLCQSIGTLLAPLMLAVVMILPLFMYLDIQSGQSVLGKLNESLQITVYMDTDMASSNADAAKNLLQRGSRTDKARFISKQEGLKELQTNLDQNLVSMLDGNSLPNVFIVTPDPTTSPDQMQTIYRNIIKLPRVESATMDTEWVQILYHISEFTHKILWLLPLTLGMALVLVTYNTIRLQILGRKEELEITKLLGAPASFIHHPFLYQAMWQSIFFAAVSLGLSARLSAEVQLLVGIVFKPYDLNIGQRFFTFSGMSLVLGFVIALDIFGTWLATAQYLLGLKAKK